MTIILRARLDCPYCGDVGAEPDVVRFAGELPSREYRR